MTLLNRIKQRALEQQRQVDTLRPELAGRADRVRLIMEPSLKNFLPSELGLLSDFLVAKLREYRANAELEIIKAEQERAVRERRTK
ncbi:MAG TPA: hypothetical protein VIH54_11480 [Chthoniobacterales bacterium]|jgi:hypothetical protein